MLGVAVTVACLLQCGGGVFTGPIRARPGRRAWCDLCCCIRSATATGGGGRSLPLATVPPPLAGFLLLGFVGLANMDHGETTVMIARPWGVCWWVAELVEH